MKSDRTYVIEMRSKQFDTLLQLQNAKGETPAENDDIDARGNYSALGCWN